MVTQGARIMAEGKKIGFDDTPLIPGTKWHVHDGQRPQPPVVAPGGESTQDSPGAPPSDAIILFDGLDASGWVKSSDGVSPIGWKVADGYMEVTPKTGGIATRASFGDCQLHVEWASPTAPSGDDQGRGNSGVFLMGLYEIQVLDCYDNTTYADGTTGGIYGQCPPLANACRRPGLWQTYDIIWIAPRFIGDGRLVPARVTVLHNGVLLHHDREVMGPTLYRQAASYQPHPETGPVVLQNHGDPVRFRNIWCRPIVGYDRA